MTAIAPALNATHAEMLGLLASIYMENNRPEKAVVLLAALDALGLAEPRQRVALALAQLRAGKPADAQATLERVAMSGAIDGPFHLVRAQVLTALARPQEAGAAMRAYVALRGANTPTSVTA